MAYKDFKDLARRKSSDKVLRDEAFNIAKNPKYVGCQCGVASVVYKFFDKKSSCGAIIQNQCLSEELHKPITRKFENGKVYLSFKDNVWDTDLADMELICKYNKGSQCLFCIFDI